MQLRSAKVWFAWYRSERWLASSVLISNIWYVTAAWHDDTLHCPRPYLGKVGVVATYTYIWLLHEMLKLFISFLHFLLQFQGAKQDRRNIFWSWTAQIGESLRKFQLMLGLDFSVCQLNHLIFRMGCDLETGETSYYVDRCNAHMNWIVNTFWGTIMNAHWNH